MKDVFSNGRDIREGDAMPDGDGDGDDRVGGESRSELKY